MSGYPGWLHVMAWVYLGLSFVCALIIAIDEFRRPQKMFVMDVVWPVTALYAGPLALWGYFKSGIKGTKRHHQQMHRESAEELGKLPYAAVARIASAPEEEQPSSEQVAVAVCHCGAGCTLGDIVGEWSIFGTGLIIAAGEFGTRLLLDFLLAWAFGVAFQYLTIVPMRNLSFGKGVLQAMRVDTLSIVAFQIGMSVWAALAYFVFFPNPHLKVDEAVFWFMMQIGMMLGFATAYPVNHFLIKSGWKEKMPRYKQHIKQQMARKQMSNARDLAA